MGGRDKMSLRWLGYGLNDTGYESGQPQNFILQNVQTPYGANPASCLVGTEDEATEREPNHCTPSGAEIKNQ